MNLVAYNALNSIAVAAKTAGDANTIAQMEELVIGLSQIPAAFDTVSAVTTPQIIPFTPVPLSGTIAPSFDSLLAVTARIDLAGG